MTRTALLLPGQGSQRPGMGAPWQGTPWWSLVQDASDALDLDVAHLLLDADAEELRPTARAQVATHVVSLMALAAVQERVTAQVVAGHSLGEYTALVAAGVLAPADAVRLVSERGAAMQAACDRAPGTMAAVLGADADVEDEACARTEDAWPANYNAPQHVVVSGTAAGVAAAGEAAKALGARRVLPLPVGGAFHTPLMEPAVPRLRAALAAAPYRDAQVPVLSNVDAALHTDGWAARLEAQLLSPVRWAQTMEALVAQGVQRVVECGPGGVLIALARRVDGLTAVAVAGPADLEALS
jgi:[acyl-carrier-protein] S-malonyltransferase